MINKYFILLLFLIIPVFSNAQIAFQKAYYQMSLYQSLTKPTSDDGYIMSGQCYSSTTNEDAFLMKLNAFGDTLWTKSYAHPGYDDGKNVIQANDGGFFMVASSYVLKTDSIGQPLWSRSFYSQFDANVFCAVESTNGDLIIAGRVYFSAPNPEQLLIAKLDSNGNLLFAKSFGAFHSFSPSSIHITNDNGYIISGQSDYVGPNNDGVLIKTDSSGNPLWTRKYGSNQADWFNYAIQLNDGSFMAIGASVSNYGIFLVKADTSGNLLWAKTYKINPFSSYNLGYMINKTSDNNLVFCGKTSGGETPLLGKIDTSGSVIWVKGYRPVIASVNACFNSVFETSDLGLIASGYFAPSSSGYLYLIKTDSAGNSNCFVNNYSLTVMPLISKDSSFIYTTTNSNITNLTVQAECFCDTSNTLCIGTGLEAFHSVSSINVSPNPFSNKLDISMGSEMLYKIILYDISGRNLLQRKFTNSVSLNTEQLAKGLYLYEVRGKNGLCKKGKVVKD